MAKRSAVRDLNHDNWDREDEPEEAGHFHKADDETMKTRLIRTAKRRSVGTTLAGGDNTSSPVKNPFSGLSFGAAKIDSTPLPFSFLKTEPMGSGTVNQNSSQTTKAMTKMFSPTTTTASDTSQNPFANVLKMIDKSKPNLESLKDLNMSCSKWIVEHLNKNPYCILTPIFKDYADHLSKLGLGKEVEEGNIKGETENEENQNAWSNKKDKEKTEDEKQKTTWPKQTSPILKTSNAAPFSLGSAPSFSFGIPPKKDNTELASKNGSSETGSKMASFQFQASGTTSVTTPSTGLAFTFSAKPPAGVGEEAKQEDAEDEPPKNEFVPVVEEDSVYDTRCKVFVKKDGDFKSKGVGTLFLKPVGGKKTQLVVRADTSIGNILLNLLINSSMPVQSLGNNNVMIVCLPTPDAKPPPIPVLIKVKTTEDRDMLLLKLEDCKNA